MAKWEKRHLPCLSFIVQRFNFFQTDRFSDVYSDFNRGVDWLTHGRSSFCLDGYRSSSSSDGSIEFGSHIIMKLCYLIFAYRLNPVWIWSLFRLKNFLKFHTEWPCMWTCFCFDGKTFWSSIRSDPVCELVFALIEKLFEVPYGVTHSVCELAFALSETKKTSSGFQPGIWFDRKTFWSSIRSDSFCMWTCFGFVRN